MHFGKVQLYISFHLCLRGRLGETFSYGRFQIYRVAEQMGSRNVFWKEQGRLPDSRVVDKKEIDAFSDSFL